MILIAGIPSETPLQLAIHAAELRGFECVVFNQRHTAHNDLVVDYNQGKLTGVLFAGGKEYRLEDFKGVYTRMLEAATLPEFQPSRTRPTDYRALERATFLTDSLRKWIDAAPCRVLNRSAAMLSNSSKPYQAMLINRAGLETPITVVTNDPEQVRAFLAEHDRVIFKSISGVRSIVKELDSERLKHLDKIRNLPTQFQAFVPGFNVRVHVVGSQIFATEIRSEAVDYRYGGRDGHESEMAPFSLPAQVADKCFALARSLDLPLCGIDFKVTPEGRFVCFEVNPSPAYSYYEEATGQDISGAIVEFLKG